MPVVIVAAAVLGLAIGSFLNVVIYRVPAGLSLVRPASHCPSCGQPIRSRHNIPILGWLILRGKCARCAAGISPRYPLVELLTSALFVLMTVRIMRLHLSAALPAYLYFTAAGIALALIDLACRRLPDAIVLPSYPVLAVLLISGSWIRHDWSSSLRALIGAAALYAFYCIAALAYRGGMGWGDVKLAGLLGGLLGYLSWNSLVVGSFAAFLLGGIVGLAMIAFRAGSRKSTIPFGPFMIVGAWIGLLFGSPLAHAYLQHVQL
jgi:leader peptidase (prepilin peptidase)/N-methyltransferase